MSIDSVLRHTEGKDKIQLLLVITGCILVSHWLTVTVTTSDAVQLFTSVTKRVYAVVPLGEAIGLATPALFSPADGDQA
jgi:hypothetical protein